MLFLEHFNVLWRDNWTQAAGKVLKNFEQAIVRKTKSEGYDGGEGDANRQWTFTGALLYSVTVITTIGTLISNLLLSHSQNSDQKYYLYYQDMEILHPKPYGAG